MFTDSAQVLFFIFHLGSLRVSATSYCLVLLLVVISVFAFFVKVTYTGPMLFAQSVRSRL